MEDRFKFRAWDGEKMHYKLLIGNTDTKDFENYTAHCLYDYESKQWKNFDEMSDIVIMQCTGLKDKNGKLIYESDIVKRNKDVGVIAYSDLQARLVFNKGSHSYSLSSLESYEIIGNIYESHPELLEGN